MHETHICLEPIGHGHLSWSFVMAICHGHSVHLSMYLYGRCEKKKFATFRCFLIVGVKAARKFYFHFLSPNKILEIG